MNSFYKLRCVACEKTVAEKAAIARCPECGEALNVVYNANIFKKRIQKYFQSQSTLSTQKYWPFLPIHSQQQLNSLGEGGTPLIKLNSIGAKLKLSQLFIKNEGQNPTGVFKDRGSIIELAKALELKAKAVVTASTGNMAASVAAYAAINNLPCYVLIPEGTPLGKLAQALSFGARILQIRGTYADCCVLVEKIAHKHNFYLAGDYAFRGEGQKTLAFEIVEQLGWQVPDCVIVPVGCGTNLAAIWQGFQEFHQMGLIKKLPKMVAVQPSSCATIVAAWQKKLPKAVFVENPQTVCSAVGIGKPLDDQKCLAALAESKGTGVTVLDHETLLAQKQLGSLAAIFVETSAALPLAALQTLKRRKFIQPNSKIVLIATGLGLKDPQSVLAAHPAPPTVEPNEAELDRFFKYKLYAVAAADFRERNKILFKRLPSLQQLKSIIKNEFKADLKDSHLHKIWTEIKIFLQKGKSISKTDLQNLVEQALADLTYAKRALRICDYKLVLQRKIPPKAMVTVEFNGKRMQAQAEGVGPVDAIIRAIRKALQGKTNLREKLVDFSVRVSSGETDATTEVTLKLSNNQGQEVTARVSSPDIITASVGAFEKAWSILWQKNKNK